MKWRIITVVAILALYVGYAHPEWIVDPSFLPTASADKLDNCDPTATVGRCADKCPPGQHQNSIDPETGAAVCEPDAQPKPAPQPMSAKSVYVNSYVAPPEASGFRGK